MNSFGLLTVFISSHAGVVLENGLASVTRYRGKSKHWVGHLRTEILLAVHRKKKIVSTKALIQALVFSFP